jgi:hypothetical protein
MMHDKTRGVFTRATMQRLLQTVPLPRLGALSQWERRDLIDPETLEIVACCVVWAYGPIGAFTCSEGMTDTLFPDLPDAFQEEVGEQCVGDVDHLLAWIRRESVEARGQGRG